jgi:hypothetical protein
LQSVFRQDVQGKLPFLTEPRKFAADAIKDLLIGLESKLGPMLKDSAGASSHAFACQSAFHISFFLFFFWLPLGGGLIISNALLQCSGARSCKLGQQLSWLQHCCTAHACSR